MIPGTKTSLESTRDERDEFGDQRETTRDERDATASRRHERTAVVPEVTA